MITTIFQIASGIPVVPPELGEEVLGPIATIGIRYTICKGTGSLLEGAIVAPLSDPDDISIVSKGATIRVSVKD